MDDQAVSSAAEDRTTYRVGVAELGTILGIWAHAVRVFNRVDGVDLIDRPPIREISVGARYRQRVKKHDIEARSARTPTQDALAWSRNSSFSTAWMRSG